MARRSNTAARAAEDGPAAANDAEAAAHAGETTVARRRAELLRAGSVVAMPLEDFAAAYGVSRRTAYRLIACGAVEACKAGERTLVIRESADAWLAARPRIHPTSPKTADRSE